jgi:hypothetical protein
MYANRYERRAQRTLIDADWVEVSRLNGIASRTNSGIFSTIHYSLD